MFSYWLKVKVGVVVMIVKMKENFIHYKNGCSKYLRPGIQRLAHTDLIADNINNRGPGAT